MSKHVTTPPRPLQSVLIRPARASDVAALAQLENSIFTSDRMSRRSLAAFATRPSARFLVACRGTDVLGYALVLTRRDSRAARLYSLAVAESAGRSGIGAALLAAAEDAALALGAAGLRLEVRADNAAAIRLYERHGYRAFGRIEGYYADGMAAVRYARPLAHPRSTRPIGRAA